MIRDAGYRVETALTRYSLRTQAVAILLIGVVLLIGGHDEFRWPPKVGVFYLVVGSALFAIAHTDTLSFRWATAIASIGVGSSVLYIATTALLSRLAYNPFTVALSLDIIFFATRRSLDVTGMAGLFLHGVARDITERQVAVGLVVAAFGLVLYSNCSQMISNSSDETPGQS